MVTENINVEFGRFGRAHTGHPTSNMFLPRHYFTAQQWRGALLRDALADGAAERVACMTIGLSQHLNSVPFSHPSWSALPPKVSLAF